MLFSWLFISTNTICISEPIGLHTHTHTHSHTRTHTRTHTLTHRHTHSTVAQLSFVSTRALKVSSGGQTGLEFEKERWKEGQREEERERTRDSKIKIKMKMLFHGRHVL